MTNTGRTLPRSPAVAQRSALTLVELVVVMTILVALGGMVVPRLLSTSENARDRITLASAVEIRDAVVRFWSDCKYAYPAAPIESQRLQLGHLFDMPGLFDSDDTYDPQVALGWNGPYLESDGKAYFVAPGQRFTPAIGAYGDPSQLAIRDVYNTQDLDGGGVRESGSPFVIQEPTLVAVAAVPATYVLGQPREVRIVSAGPDGELNIDERWFATDLEIQPGDSEAVREEKRLRKGDDVYVSFTLR